MSPTARAHAALSRNKPEVALRIATDALSGSLLPAELGRLRWLGAQAAVRMDQRPQALQWLQALGTSSHALAPWARLVHADLVEHTDPARAVRLARKLQFPWAGRTQARSVEARALVQLGKRKEAIEKLVQLIADEPRDLDRTTTQLALAQALGSEGAPLQDQLEALALYRTIEAHHPTSETGKLAASRIESLVEQLPPDARRAASHVPFRLRFTRAEALLDAFHYQDAEAEARQLARDATTPARRCRSQLLQGKALLRLRERERGATLLERVARQCKEPDVRVPALFLAGRAWSRVDEPARAIKRWDQLIRLAPSHRLADDAMLGAARMAEELGNTDEMKRRLAQVPSRWPLGDMRGRARFLLAWHARKQGDGTQALAQLQLAATEGPQEDREDLHGRAAYWRARQLQDLGRIEQALQAWEELARAWPLTYYGQLSMKWLQELDPPRAAELVHALGGATTAREPVPELSFPYRPELADEGFARAIALLQVGSAPRALMELHAIGLIGPAADRDARWLVAALLDAAGEHAEASRLVRARLSGLMRTAPVGRSAALWRLGYPNAFEELIDEVARAQKVPSDFIRAIAREESAFDPMAVSFAGARGLIQLMEPTAQRFAKAAGLPSDPQSLHDPAINLQIGSRFIAFLWQRYADNPALVPAAYNAGEHAVDRWLAEKPNLQLDEFVEEIPYSETRRYTRRVLQTYGIYNWIGSGELPDLPSAIPSSKTG